MGWRTLPLLVIVMTILTSSPSPTLATRSGDEGYAANAPNITGTFYAFADKAIHVINPATRQIIKNITADNNGRPLTNVGAIGGAANTSRTWNDPVYLEDPERGLRYVFINEADVYRKPNGEQVSYVTVIDTNNDTIVARLEVGPNPVHIYAVNGTKEIWSHSDDTGEFSVIALDDVTNLSSARVPGLVRKAGHGKLLVEDELFPTAYATNVNEQVLFEYDLEARNRTGAYNFSTLIPADAACSGTHSIAYSKINKHAYAECIGKGTLEWDTATNQLVKFWPHGGMLASAPGDDYVLSVDGLESKATILQPAEPGQPSTFVSEVPVPGNPDKTYFFSTKPGIDQQLTAYTVYFPLTRNTNRYTLQTAARLLADPTSESYLEKPNDCQDAGPSSPGTVQAASDETPALSLAKGANRKPLTPSCGACGYGYEPFDPTVFNGSLSGFRVLELLKSGVGEGAAKLVPAGAILPIKNVGQYGPANECSFLETYRPAKRGGRFVGTVAVIPEPAIYFVEPGRDPYTAYPVKTAPFPKQLAWAPIAPPA